MQSTVILAAGEQTHEQTQAGPTAADWWIAGGTVAAAVIALVAMGVSIFFGVRSGRTATKVAFDAGTASKALEGIQKIEAQRAIDERRDLARLVTVDAAQFMGRQGVTVHNGSPTHTVHDIDFDFPPDHQVVVISARGAVPETAPVEIPRLGPGETTADRSVLQKVGGADGRTLIREARIRFRDGRGDWWERGGNGEPVRIGPQR